MDTKLQDALKKANSEVEKAKITDPELKKIAFSKAMDFYLHSEDMQSQKSQKNVTAGVPEISGDFWGTLGNATGIDAKKLKDVYAIKNDQILLIVSSVPGESKADKQRNLAALILLAYHEGLGREWVTSSLLAEAASHSKLYDTSKFAKNLKFDWFRAEGVKKGLKYKLSGPGTSRAKEFLLEITE